MTMERAVYINDEMIVESKAKVSIFDVGFLYGVTLYKFMKSKEKS